MSRAERQYQLAEPENRLVVRTLESRWEEALKQLEQGGVLISDAETLLAIDDGGDGNLTLA